MYLLQDAYCCDGDHLGILKYNFLYLLLRKFGHPCLDKRRLYLVGYSFSEMKRKNVIKIYCHKTKCLCPLIVALDNCENDRYTVKLLVRAWVKYGISHIQ